MRLPQNQQSLSHQAVKADSNGIEGETHGSVFPHIFSSGYRELWGTGLSFVAAVAQAGISEVLASDK